MAGLHLVLLLPSPIGPPPINSSKNPCSGSSIHHACHQLFPQTLAKKGSTFGSTRRIRSGGEWGTMMPRASHPVVHPDPAPPPAPAPPAPAPAPAPAAQGQGQQAAAPVPAPAPAPAPPAAMQVHGQGNANAGPNAPPGVRMRDFPGAPGTRFGLGLRLAQAVLAAVALAAMASAADFASVTSFRYLVPAAALQCLWSLAVAAVDVYALLVGRRFRTPRTVGVFVVGDWITGALTFSAASASAGVTTLINNDLEY